MRVIELTPTLSVRPTDPSLQGELDRYLELLSTTHSTGLRHLTLDALGQGSASASRQLHQRSARLEGHLPHRLPARAQWQSDPAGLGRRRQHRRRRLGQRAALARRRRAAKLHPAAFAAALHPPARDPHRHRSADDAANARSRGDGCTELRSPAPPPPTAQAFANRKDLRQQLKAATSSPSASSVNPWS